MQARFLLMPSVALMLAACQPAPAAKAISPPAPDLVAQGEYVAKLGGCNDCHTPGYGAAAGRIPRERWLTGSPQGFMGPWGTTYPSNLRLSVSRLSESEWMAYSSSFHTRPPMPDFTVRDLAEQDRRALYRFISSLGPAGTEAPAYLPPGQTPPAPYFQLVLPDPASATAGPEEHAAKPVPAS